MPQLVPFCFINQVTFLSYIVWIVVFILKVMFFRFIFESVLDWYKSVSYGYKMDVMFVLQSNLNIFFIMLLLVASSLSITPPVCPPGLINPDPDTCAALDIYYSLQVQPVEQPSCIGSLPRAIALPVSSAISLYANTYWCDSIFNRVSSTGSYQVCKFGTFYLTQFLFGAVGNMVNSCGSTAATATVGSVGLSAGWASKYYFCNLLYPANSGPFAEISHDRCIGIADQLFAASGNAFANMV